jgi:hypothetical protein
VEDLLQHSWMQEHILHRMPSAAKPPTPVSSTAVAAKKAEVNAVSISVDCTVMTGANGGGGGGGSSGTVSSEGSIASSSGSAETTEVCTPPGLLFTPKFDPIPTPSFPTFDPSPHPTFEPTSPPPSCPRRPPLPPPGHGIDSQFSTKFQKRSI